MTDDRGRAEPVGLHRGRQRDLHGEQGRLHAVDPGHGVGRCDRCGHREAGFFGDQRLGGGHRCGEDRFGAEQVGTHPSPLRTLPGEHPHRSAVVLAHGGRVEHVIGRAVGDLPQRLGQLGVGGSDRAGTHRPVVAPACQRVGQIGRCYWVAVRAVLDPVGQPAGCLAQRLRLRWPTAGTTTHRPAGSGLLRCAVVRSGEPVRERRARWCPTCHTTRPPRAAALYRPGRATM